MRVSYFLLSLLQLCALGWSLNSNAAGDLVASEAITVQNLLEAKASDDHRELGDGTKSICTATECLNGGFCALPLDSKCTCPSGWLGLTCSRSWCRERGCLNAGSCTDGDTSCICPAGFQGRQCQWGSDTHVLKITSAGGADTYINLMEIKIDGASNLVATLSSTYSALYPASNCVDGNVHTMCHSGSTSASLRIHFTGTATHVSVTNRVDAFQAGMDRIDGSKMTLDGVLIFTFPPKGVRTYDISIAP